MRTFADPVAAMANRTAEITRLFERMISFGTVSSTGVRSLYSGVLGSRTHFPAEIARRDAGDDADSFDLFTLSFVSRVARGELHLERSDLALQRFQPLFPLFPSIEEGFPGRLRCGGEPVQGLLVALQELDGAERGDRLEPPD